MLTGFIGYAITWDTNHCEALQVAEKALQTYERDGWSEFNTQIVPERREIRPTADRGPILLCVDTSGSMRGPREVVAKALALECMRAARAQARTFLTSPVVATIASSTGRKCLVPDSGRQRWLALQVILCCDLKLLLLSGARVLCLRLCGSTRSAGAGAWNRHGLCE